LLIKRLVNMNKINLQEVKNYKKLSLRFEMGNKFKM